MRNTKGTSISQKKMEKCLITLKRRPRKMAEIVVELITAWLC